MRTCYVIALPLLLALGCATPRHDPLAKTFLADMMYLEPGAESARASSYDETGMNRDWKTIQPSATLELANIEGAGCIQHIYFTIAGPKHYLRDLVLRFYWDGEETPSVETPFGDFFGVGHERMRFFRNLVVTVNEGGSGFGGTHGFNAYFPMPFAKGARLTLTNEGNQPTGNVWYHVNYEKLPHIPKNVGRFHAQFRQERPTQAVRPPQGTPLWQHANLDGKENYVILEAEGLGNFAGYFLNVENLHGGWYGEGDDMIFIDDDTWPPSFHGTGTEEIFGGGACPNVEYQTPYSGFHLAGNLNFDGKTSMYRFQVNDPIRFNERIKVTIEHGHANDLSNEYSSCAFWYQSEPHAPFPALPPAAERHAILGEDPHDQAYQALYDFQGQFGRLRSIPPGAKTSFTMDDLKNFFYWQVLEAPALFKELKYDEVIKGCETRVQRIDEIMEEARKAVEQKNK